MPPAEKYALTDATRVTARVEYQGRPYYLVARSKAGDRVRLCTLEAKVDFWADASACRTIKEYAPRSYRGRDQHTTLGSLRRFVAGQQDPRTRRGPCTECGTWGPSGEPCRDCGGEGSHA